MGTIFLVIEQMWILESYTLIQISLKLPIGWVSEASPILTSTVEIWDLRVRGYIL